MNRVDVVALAHSLSERDLMVLRTLRAHRLATTTQLQRWHYPHGETQVIGNSGTALRLTQRTLRRLARHDLVAKLHQRIGGVRRGSDSTVWQLGATGDRLLSTLDAQRRRRYVEPGTTFITHTVAVTELAVQLVEAQHLGKLDHVALTGEPGNWRRFNGLHGRVETLKPDLHAVTFSDDYEDHWMCERDLSTEHPSVVVRQAHIYERYAATGDYQRTHGILPAVLWIVNDPDRQQALTRALASARGLTPGLHRVVLSKDFLTTVLAGNTTPADL